MRSRMLRVCSRMSLPSSPVTGCRSVWPETKTRLPNRVAGDRLGFGFAASGLMISFLGMAALLPWCALVAGDYNAAPEGSTNGQGHPDRGDEHRPGRRGRVPRLVRHRAPAGAAARARFSLVPALDRGAGRPGLRGDLRPPGALRDDEPGLPGHRRREPVAVVQARHRPGRAPHALRGRADPAGRPAAARQRRRAVAQRDERRARGRSRVQRVVRQGARPRPRRRPGRALRAPLPWNRQSPVRGPLSPRHAGGGGVRGVEEGARERLVEPAGAAVPRSPAPRPATLRARPLRGGVMIPVIDLGPYLAARPGAFGATARELGQALEDVGFFVIVNHGVPPPLIDRTFAEARRFHAQPMEAKLALRMNEHNNGYMMLGRYAVWTSEVNANDKPDLNEAFFVKRERGPDDPLVRAGRRFAGPNQWPADLPGFREAVLAYTDTVDALGRALLPLCATALELPPDTFDGAFAESQFSFRLTHYPPVAAEPNQFAIAPHTDANFMTFLAQSEVPGLQVRLPDATWADVPYVPGSFAVNSGDTLRRWTNDRFKSTPHRALPPVGRPRYAIPYFMGPHLDTEIACLPTCQGPGNPPRHPPITYAAYLDWWYDANYNASRQRDVVASDQRDVAAARQRDVA